jgi:hypothetical protein
MRNHFLHPVHRKNRLEQSRLSEVLGRPTVLRTNNLLLDVLNKHFVEFDETMFKVFESPLELIFYIPGIEKATWTKFLKRCFN